MSYSKFVKSCLSLFLLFAGFSGYAQYTMIPDSAFEAQLIERGIDTEAIFDGQVLTADAEAVTDLNLSNTGILDFSGIEAFTSLTSFWPAYNDITTLDLSALTELTDLRVTATLLDSIDISHNTKLVTCYIIAGNGISEVDFSNNPDIRYLLLGSNNISEVDVSNLTDLRWFHVNHNPITSIDISNNPLITVLNIDYTGIQDVDLSLLPALRTLQARNIGLTDVDFSTNVNLTKLILSDNQLTQLSVDHLPSLSELVCGNNSISHLDVSQNPVLNRLNASNAGLASLNVKNGNNDNFYFMVADDNPNLHCIQVDDPLYSDTTWNSVDAGVVFSDSCAAVLDCSAFDTAPLELTKSFDPVNGVADRLQVKWYKSAGGVKYSVEDNAACDIEYWPYRYTENLGQDWIQIPSAERDTLLLPYTTVKKTNGKKLFKWPIKYRLNNGTNQVQPNTGYKWRVRCYCDQGELVNGEQVLSPWSEVKYFNTPDFDPETGIHYVSGKSMETSKEELSDKILVYPNPTSGNELNVKSILDDEILQLEVYNLSGQRVIHSASMLDSNLYKLEFSSRLPAGIYTISVVYAERALRKQFLVQ